MFGLFTLNIMEARETSKIIATFKGLLGTCIKSKKAAYIQYAPNQLVKIHQCNRFATFGLSSCLS